MSREPSRASRSTGPKTWGRLLVIVAFALIATWFQGHRTTSSTEPPAQSTAIGGQPSVDSKTLPAFLPAQARQTLDLIARGGPFPHPQDGGVFGNYEGRLPAKPRGWYHEYTVDTPGASNRGTRRIITGGTPPQTYWYTDDHYASFRQFEVPGQ